MSLSTPDIPSAEVIEPRIRGRFNLYDTPDGSIHIAYVADGEEETKHFEIPAMLIKLAKAGAEGKMNPLQMVKAMMNHAG